jgi:hypothetical protein
MEAMMTTQSDEIRQLRRLVNASFALWLVAMLGIAWAVFRPAPRVVTAREIVIRDERGTTRARIAAPLPEPIMNGKVTKRDDTVSCVMLYDAQGNERGGYVTDNSVGNAFLTLDSNNGQEVTLVAYPRGGAEFGINDDQQNKVTMSALTSGPAFRLVRSGQVVFRQPIP